MLACSEANENAAPGTYATPAANAPGSNAVASTPSRKRTHANMPPCGARVSETTVKVDAQVPADKGSGTL